MGDRGQGLGDGRKQGIFVGVDQCVYPKKSKNL